MNSIEKYSYATSNLALWMAGKITDSRCARLGTVRRCFICILSGPGYVANINRFIRKRKYKESERRDRPSDIL